MVDAKTLATKVLETLDKDVYVGSMLYALDQREKKLILNDLRDLFESEGI
jgi:hypothetical protein